MIPDNKLPDLMEVRHNLVKYHGYSIADLDDMTPMEVELTVLMISASNNKD